MHTFLHLYSLNGEYSVFNSFPPLRRFDDHASLENERRWFFGDAPVVSAKVTDLRIQLYGEFAIASFFVDNTSGTKVTGPAFEGLWYWLGSSQNGR